MSEPGPRLFNEGVRFGDAKAEREVKSLFAVKRLE